MRLLTALFAVAIATPCAFAQTPATSTATPIPVSPDTRAAVSKLIGEVMVNGKAYDYDRHLADDIGPRAVRHMCLRSKIIPQHCRFHVRGLASPEEEVLVKTT